MQVANGKQTQAQINMTPMIDILLVLIIIFLVINPNKTEGLPAELPSPSDNGTPAAPSTIVLNIGKETGYEINGQPVASADLGSRLAAIFQMRSDKCLFVKGDPALEYEAVARAMDIARGAGIQRVGLLGSK